MVSTKNEKIPVLRILSDSILIAWRNAARYSTALAIPTLLLVAIWAFNWLFLDQEVGLTAWAIWAVYKVAFVIFAVACHRLALLEDLKSSFLIRFSIREVKFLGWLIAVYAIVYLILSIPLTVAMNVSGDSNGTDLDDALYYANWVFSIPAMYVLARLCLVFPATAIDMPFGLKRSWNYTRTNGWRIVAIVGLYPWLISTAIWLFSREDATVLEQVLTGLLFYGGLALEVFALSLTYKAIVGSGGQGALSA